MINIKNMQRIPTNRKKKTIEKWAKESKVNYSCIRHGRHYTEMKIRDKQGYYIIRKWLIHQEDNHKYNHKYVHTQHRTSKYIKQILTDLKGDIDNNINNKGLLIHHFP